MGKFSIQIAGKTAEVTALFESTRDYCRAYLTEKEADFSVGVDREDLVFEQEFYLQEAREEGIRPRIFPDPFLERSAIQRKVAKALFRWDVLMFHGSTVAVDGEGFLFTARCGTGKSTHTRLWRETFGSRAVMVNDDKPFLQITEEGVVAHGAPWSGKHGLDSNIAVPLKGICILERGTENRIRRISREEAVPMLLKQGCCPLEPGSVPKYQALVEALAEKTPLWHMTCTKDIQAAQVSYEAMSGAG